MQNTPALWLSHFPRRMTDSHKYTAGHAVIYAAPELTGATRLAAEACARIGAGLVTVLAPESVVNVYRASLPAHILVRQDLQWWDKKVTATLYGSGGISEAVRVKERVAAVLDADALAALPPALNPLCVLTPHEGEFALTFPDIHGSREARARQAALESGAIVVLKGAETVIAAPDGRLAVNCHASPALATAGTGDVLAGMITGLLAQGMPGFEAACAAVWIHGDCALRFGSGLVASDLPDLIPAAVQELLGFSEKIR